MAKSSGVKLGGVGGGDAELAHRAFEALFGDRYERRHAAREAEEGEEADAAVERRGEAEGVEIEDDGDLRALLAGEQKQRFVVFPVVSGGVDEGEGAELRV